MIIKMINYNSEQPSSPCLPLRRKFLTDVLAFEPDLIEISNFYWSSLWNKPFIIGLDSLNNYAIYRETIYGTTFQLSCSFHLKDASSYLIKLLNNRNNTGISVATLVSVPTYSYVEVYL